MIKNFLKHLKGLGWTQEAIARFTGLTQSQISKLERGKPCQLETAIKIADAFNVTLDEVANRSVTGEDKKQREEPCIDDCRPVAISSRVILQTQKEKRGQLAQRAKG